MTKHKSFLFGCLFFLSMGGYALLRELRDCLFIHLVGISGLPCAKIIALFFLFSTLFLYQILIHKKGSSYTFLFFSSFYSILLFTAGILFYFKLTSINHIFGYFFYGVLEGYPPFIWSLLWSIFINDSDQQKIQKKSLFVSFCAQLGGLVCSWGTYVLIKKNYFITPESLFSAILFFSSTLLVLIIIIYIFLKPLLLSSIQNNITPKKKYILSNFFNGLYSIINSYYISGIFMLVFCWELINIILNYIRLDFLSEQATTNSIHLLENLYCTIGWSYVIGIFVVLCGYSFLVKKYGIKISLMSFPSLLIITMIPCFYFMKIQYLIKIYMIIKALYPALIFPLKEILYSITNHETQFQSKSLIDSLGSRLSKTTAAFYIYLIINIWPTQQYYIHAIFFSVLLLLFLLLSWYVGKKFEKEKLIN